MTLGIEYYLLSNNTKDWYKAHVNKAEVILSWWKVEKLH